MPWWEDYVLETALFASENRYALPKSQTLCQIRYIATLFWGQNTHANVIVSLFERSKLEFLGEVYSLSLEEIHAFMTRVVMRMHKEEVVKAIDLPFVNLTHPFYLEPFGYRHYGLLADSGVIAAYESGKSNGEMMRDWNYSFFTDDFTDRDVLDQEFSMIGTYFWGEMLPLFLKGFESTVASYESERLKIFKGMRVQIENGKSREKILEDLGLPSASYLYSLIKEGKPDRYKENTSRLILRMNGRYVNLFLPLSLSFSSFSITGDEHKHIDREDFACLMSTIRKSVANLFFPYDEAQKLVKERSIKSRKEYKRLLLREPLSRESEKLQWLPSHPFETYSLSEFGGKWKSWNAFFGGV